MRGPAGAAWRHRGPTHTTTPFQKGTLLWAHHGRQGDALVPLRVGVFFHNLAAKLAEEDPKERQEEHQLFVPSGHPLGCLSTLTVHGKRGKPWPSRCFWTTATVLCWLGLTGVEGHLEGYTCPPQSKGWTWDFYLETRTVPHPIATGVPLHHHVWQRHLDFAHQGRAASASLPRMSLKASVLQEDAGNMGSS